MDKGRVRRDEAGNLEMHGRREGLLDSVEFRVAKGLFLGLELLYAGGPWSYGSEEGLRDRTPSPFA